MAKFEIYRDESGEYRWRFRTDNNEIVATGEGYPCKDDCEHAIQLLKDQVPLATVINGTRPTLGR